MDNFKNIEDIFKDNLKDFNVNPTERVWNGIKSNLWYSDIQNIFRNFSIQPANSVWRTIAFRLWFKKFITYSPATLNVYYLFSVVLIGFTFFYALNQSEPILNSEKSGLSGTDETVINPNNLPYSVRNLNIAVNQLSDKTIATNKSNESDKIEYRVNDNKINVIKNNKITANNIITINEGLHHEPLLVSEENESEILFRDNSIINFIKPVYSELNINPDVENFSNREVNENILKKWHWSVEGFIMPMTSSATYDVNDNEYPDFSKNYKGDASPSNTLSGGLLLQSTHMNLSFQTGVLLTSLSDRPNYQFTGYSMDTSLITQIIPGGHYIYDSIPILDLDYLLQTGDSEYLWVKDSAFVPEKDTITVQQINARKYTEYQRTSNTFTYVELPVIAGYTFSQGKINLTLRAGVIFGLLSYSGGEIPSPYSESGTDVIQRNNCRKLLLSGITNLEIAYDATSHISIVTAPVYRFSLSSVFNKNYLVDQRFSSFGIKFGLRYKL